MIKAYDAKQWEIPLLLDNRRMVTRRVVRKSQCILLNKIEPCELRKDNMYAPWDGMTDAELMKSMYKPPFQPGDILYVRETWCGWHLPYGWRYEYKATNPNGNKRPTGEEYDDEWEVRPWRPSNHMPKEAARIWLKVTDVRVERLQDITEEQAEAEGISEEWAMNWWEPTYYDPDSGGYPKYRDTFAFNLWDTTIKKSDIDRYGWYANPWVWVIEFERCEKPEPCILAGMEPAEDKRPCMGYGTGQSDEPCEICKACNQCIGNDEFERCEKTESEG